jgi:glycosyltransferase involved in cell wall biosynthesis
MRLAVLSDTRLPSNPQTAGHGLGHIMHAIAEGLKDCGHETVFYAGVGSAFSGKLLTAVDEREFAAMDFSGYDAILDGGHFHTLARMQPGLPVLNLSHDREREPGRNAVFPSKAHRAHHGYNERDGIVIYNGVTVPPTPEKRASSPYFAYLSMFHTPKQPLLAMEAARLAGVRLVMAGPTPPAPPPGAEYVGPLTGQDKINFLAGATALVFPSAIEAGPLTPLEAQAVGTPVIVSAYGGARENMNDGVTGFTARDTVGFAAAIGSIGKIDRAACKQWIVENRSVGKMVDEYEKLLAAVSAGMSW